MQCPNCRTSLPAGSRFCNGCGASMGAPAANPHGPNQQPQPMPPPRQWGQPAQPGQPQGQPQQGHPGYAQPGTHQPQYGQPDNRTMGYQNPAPAYSQSAPAPEAKKPIGLLIGIVVLLLAVVAGGTVMVVKGREKTQGSVIVAQNPSLPEGPGTLQSEAPAAPAGPGVLTNRSPRQPSAPAVTGGTKKPDDMAPSVLLGSGQAPPTAPSVVSGSTSPQAPPSPNVLVSPPPAPQPAPSVVQSRPATPPAPKPAPAPPDNSDFERYLRWLQFVENERAGLRAQAENQMYREIESYLNLLPGLADPDFNIEQATAMEERRRMMVFNNALAATRLFQRNVMRTKPPVPNDCRALDSFYMAAMEKEGQLTLGLLQAMNTKNISAITSIGRGGVGQVDQLLGRANQSLSQVYQQRGLNQLFRIETGGQSSMLGGMMGLGGLPGLR